MRMLIETNLVETYKLWLELNMCAIQIGKVDTKREFVVCRRLASMKLFIVWFCETSTGFTLIRHDPGNWRCSIEDANELLIWCT